MEEEVELQNSEQSDEGVLEQTGDDTIDTQALIEKNKQLFERAKKAEEQLKSLKKAPVPQTDVALPDLPSTDVLKLRAQGYSDTEILQLHEQASTLKTSIPRLLENPIIKEGIEAIRRKSKAEHAAPTPSSRSSAITFKGKAFSELKTDAERREAFNHRLKGNSRPDSE